VEFDGAALAWEHKFSDQDLQSVEFGSGTVSAVQGARACSWVLPTQGGAGNVVASRGAAMIVRTVSLSLLLMACAAHAADALPKPEIPDPYGLGERLALIDHLKEELHATVAEGATYDDLVKQYWEIVDKPKREAEALRNEQLQPLRSRLALEFNIKVDDKADLAQLTEMLAEAESKATARGAGGDAEPAAKEDAGQGNPAGGKARPVTIPVTVQGGTDVDLAVPAEWKVEKIQQDPSAPPTLRIVAPGGVVTLQITFFPDQESRLGTQAAADQAVKTVGEKFVGGSVEQAIRVKQLSVAGGVGSCAEFTDASFVGKKTGPGEYKVAATGVVAMGKTSAGFTLLGDSFDQAAYVAAKIIVSRMAPRADARK
jgi:hypothetical protein